MIQIQSEHLKQAAKLLARLRFARAALPAFTHVLAQSDASGVTLSVANPAQWLETHVPTVEPAGPPEEFLIPPDALKTALKADRGTVVSFARKGSRGKRALKLGVVCGGMRVETLHPAGDITSFPEGPLVSGDSTVVPGRTLEVLGLVARCASTDSTRRILEGVLFTPGDGGMVVATDGRRLANAPATVPAREFILPNAAVRVLGHPDFRERPATVTVADAEEEGKGRLVQIQSRNHLLVTETVAGSYPDWRQVVPNRMVASATVAESRRSAVVSWLRSLRGRDGSVLLQCKKRGGIRFTHESNAGTRATIEVPADITGTPEPVSLDPAYLADALEIASTLWITDALSPVVARRADGIFCVVMPKRTAREPVAPAADTGEDDDDGADCHPDRDESDPDDEGGLRPENVKRFSAVA